jgi:hypothetical protein
LGPACAHDFMQDQDKKRTKVVEYSEAYDKNGHWFRLVPARGQTGWLYVEKWANDHRYRLVAAKANMRVYRKEVGLGGIWHYTEIRLREGRLRVASWIEADTLARVLRLYRLPPAMVVEPFGFWGIRAKRSACRLLNDLLARFGDDPIEGSSKFHPADWDPTTWLLACFAALASAFSLSLSATTSEFRFALIDDILLVLLKPAAILAIVSWVSLILYEKVVVRRWETVFPRLVGMTVTLFALGLTSWQTIPDTRMDFVHSRVRYHCVESKNPTDACKQAVEALPENLRLRLVHHLQQKTSKLH